MGVKGNSFSIANHVKYIYTIMPAVKMLKTQIVTLLNWHIYMHIYWHIYTHIYVFIGSIAKWWMGVYCGDNHKITRTTCTIWIHQTRDIADYVHGAETLALYSRRENVRVLSPALQRGGHPQERAPPSSSLVIVKPPKWSAWVMPQRMAGVTTVILVHISPHDWSPYFLCLPWIQTQRRLRSNRDPPFSGGLKWMMH